MDYHALDKAGRAAYLEAVSSTHWRRVTLRWFRRSDGSPVSSITNKFLSGKISGDETRLPVQVATCELLDENYELDWSHGAHRKYRAQIIDARFVPALNDWVEYESHTGPVWTFNRQGPLVSLTIEGPEMEALGSVRKAETRNAKTLATTAVVDFLKAAGFAASNLRIPRRKAKLPRDVTIGVKAGKDQNDRKAGYQGPRRQVLKVGHDDNYWGEPREIAEALHCDLFGDGSGNIVMAPAKSRPTHRLESRHLLAPVAENPVRGDEGPNVWIGFGHDPKGPKERVHDRVELPKKHPSSPHSQRHNGKDREVIETLENKHWRKKADVTKALKARRDKAMREQTTYEVEFVPVVPWFRPGSLVNVPVAGGRASARVSQWDIPLGPGAEPARVGASRRKGFQR